MWTVHLPPYRFPDPVSNDDAALIGDSFVPPDETRRQSKVAAGAPWPLVAGNCRGAGTAFYVAARLGMRTTRCRRRGPGPNRDRSAATH